MAILREGQGKPIGYRPIGVVGAGAWGTALALVAARAGRNVTLWAREPEVLDSIRQSRQNVRFLPGVELPSNIAVTADLADTAKADALLIVVPAQHLRAMLKALKPHLVAGTPLVLCAKGIERESGKLLTEVLSEEISEAEPAILSGPSFARDVAAGLPTAVTVAATPLIAGRLQMALAQGAFRPYASDDVTGVALGGASKNVYAIGSGIVAGLNLGESARAAFLARAFAELCRLGEAMGAKRETLMGLSGLGDLVLTATSEGSRNYAFGLALGQNQSRETLFASDRPLAEGVETAPALIARAKAHKIELPIAQTITAILDGSLGVTEALPRLMARPLTSE
ncbi:MAG TPA: NAD(P)H-dependent glycerol-3-phosphate dehydrogenase [Rhizomicrobium sp.]|jgi:glycerol-3-phosphate dehydrogenase (NAD(P)+)|nr:NAD(P)H-dependent glycerol-3-phosphate dehydrogenase [Rhizomicrobium sp.]